MTAPAMPAAEAPMTWRRLRSMTVFPRNARRDQYRKYAMSRGASERVGKAIVGGRVNSASRSGRLAQIAARQLHEFEQHRLAGIDQRIERDAAGNTGTAVAGKQGDMNERGERRTIA